MFGTKKGYWVGNVTPEEGANMEDFATNCGAPIMSASFESCGGMVQMAACFSFYTLHGVGGGLYKNEVSSCFEGREANPKNGTRMRVLWPMLTLIRETLYRAPLCVVLFLSPHVWFLLPREPLCRAPSSVAPSTINSTTELWECVWVVCGERESKKPLKTQAAFVFLCRMESLRARVKAQ